MLKKINKIQLLPHNSSTCHYVFKIELAHIQLDQSIDMHLLLYRFCCITVYICGIRQPVFNGIEPIYKPSPVTCQLRYLFKSSMLY